MKLGLAMHGMGYHVSAWRLSDTPPDSNMRLDFYRDLAQTAERGLFDLIFFADFLAFPNNDRPKGVYGRSSDMITLEPLTLMASLIPVTRRIGMVCTLSTTFMPPYHIARMFASLDHLSGGRVGWNVVTSFQKEEMRNFGIETALGSAERYERAREAVDVVGRLWESWDEDAFLGDRSSGIYFDRDKIHSLDHEGKYYRVAGPLNMMRPPQGRPVIVQAGASPDGQELAAATADLVYVAQSDIESARRIYSSIKSRMAPYGRNPDDLKILPGFLPVIGATPGEAEEKYQRLLEAVDPILGVGYLAGFFGDLSHLDIDGPMPDALPNPPTMSQAVTIHQKALKEGLTIRQVAQRAAIGLAHNIVVGTPAMIADEMERWFTGGAADGFNILPAVSPVSVREFVDLVVPELQRRGLFRTAYEGPTLRSHLGLVPAAA